MWEKAVHLGVGLFGVRRLFNWGPGLFGWEEAVPLGRGTEMFRWKKTVHLGAGLYMFAITVEGGPRN
jgi:hypothetical protein